MSGIQRFITRRDRNHKLSKQNKEEVPARQRIHVTTINEIFRWLIFQLLRPPVFSHVRCSKDSLNRTRYQKITMIMRRRYSLGASLSA